MQDWIKFKRPNEFHWFHIHWNIGACKIVKADFQAVLAFPYCSVSSLRYLWLLWDWRILESSQLMFSHSAHGKYGVDSQCLMFFLSQDYSLEPGQRSQTTKPVNILKISFSSIVGICCFFCLFFLTLCCLIRNIFFMHISFFLFFLTKQLFLFNTNTVHFRY